MHDRTGEVLDGKYELIRLIGEGGMGQVYEARNLDIDRRVAIKFLLDELASKAEAVRRFQREARAAAAIGSEHICQVLDMRPPERGTPYLVMEHLSGETLAAKLSREACLSVPVALEIVLQACEALSAAHAVGIVHRDIKPENVFLVEREGKPPLVKLLDFGISKFQKRVDEGLSLTRTGTVLGTPYYMSPEQARGDRSIGPLSDLYSLGVIFYESLTGEVPYDAESFSALVVKIVSATPEHPTELRSDLPRELGDVVLKAFARESEARFQSAAELAEVLRAFAFRNGLMLSASLARSFDQGSGPPPTTMPQLAGVSRQTGTPMVWEQGERRARVRGLVIAAAVSAALLVGAGVPGVMWLVGRGGETTVPVVIVQSGPPLPAPVAEPTPPALDAAAARPETAPAVVRLRLAASPDSAVLALDGERLEGNPAEVELPADGAVHALSASAPGYRDGSREFLASPETGEVSLELEARRVRPGKGPPPARPDPPVKPPPGGTGVPGVVDPWANR